MRPVVARIAAVLLAFATSLAVAQGFPTKPIQLIVPYGPGGVTDAVARALVPAISESTGQGLLVVNRPGASTIIGMQACAKAAPDGHTLCISVPDGLSYNPHLFRNLPYDAENDFIPVINLVRGNSMLLANARMPFQSFKEMLAFARGKPGVLNWGTWGPASIPDVYLQWIKHQVGLDIAAVPYKGTGQTVPAVIAGEIDVTFMSIGAMLPHIQAGKVKPLAVVGNRRSPLLPGVPSLAEEGADPGLTSYFGIFAPAKTPRPVVERLNAEFAKALRTPQVQEFVRKQSLDVVGGSAAEFAELVKNDRIAVGKVFKLMGVRPVDAPL